MKPEISVIVVAYNEKEYIAETASFTATILRQSFASLTVVSDFKLMPVLPGTLYSTTGNGQLSAIILKCR